MTFWHCQHMGPHRETWGPSDTVYTMFYWVCQWAKSKLRTIRTLDIPRKDMFQRERLVFVIRQADHGTVFSTKKCQQKFPGAESHYRILVRFRMFVGDFFGEFPIFHWLGHVRSPSNRADFPGSLAAGLSLEVIHRGWHWNGRSLGDG
jgi:hypothetical protein